MNVFYNGNYNMHVCTLMGIKFARKSHELDISNKKIVKCAFYHKGYDLIFSKHHFIFLIQTQCNMTQ